MAHFDWGRVLLNDLPVAFLAEVFLRVVVAYLLVFAFLRITGRRGVRQLSLFELIIILTLGSAAGDVTLYEDTPIVPVVAVFIFMLMLYRLTTFLLNRIPALTNLVEGEPIVLIRDGLFELGAIQKINLTSDEIRMELRQSGVEHLGQVRLGIMESDGDISLYFYDKEETKAGLSVLPVQLRSVITMVPESGCYSCIGCGWTERWEAGEPFHCDRCGKDVAAKAISAPVQRR